MMATKSFRDFKACLAKRLAPTGFIAEGDFLSRKVDDTLIVLEIQRDRKYSTKEEIRFTINVGISVNALRVAVGDAPSLEVPPPEKCHWRERLGRLLQSQSDMWWSVRNEQTAQSVCDEIAAGVLNNALPKVEAVASSEALVRLWQEGCGQGLTEYERRTNLTKLLIALGRKEEAQLALQALENASFGRSWEASARHNVKELRKQLAGGEC